MEHMPGINRILKCLFEAKTISMDRTNDNQLEDPMIITDTDHVDEMAKECGCFRQIPGIPLYAEIDEAGMHEKIDVINHKAAILRGMIQADSPRLSELGLIVGSIPPQNIFAADPSASVDLMKVGDGAPK